jgi:hypothetical protein
MRGVGALLGILSLAAASKQAPTPAVAPVIVDVFAPTSWQPPAPAPALPAPVAAAVVAPPPTAPPLPFRFLGRYGDGGLQIAMLQRGDKLYLVTPGEIIDGTYRVERLTASTIEFTYLPLKHKQSLGTGDPG